MFFQPCTIFTLDDVQDGSYNRVWNHMFFVMLHCMEKVTDSYSFVMVMFYLSVTVNPFTTIETTLAGSDDTKISY